VYILEYRSFPYTQFVKVLCPNTHQIILRNINVRMSLCICMYACTLTCGCRLCLKCNGTRAETRFRLSTKRTCPFKPAGASVQSTTGSRDVRISGSNAGYTMFRGRVKSTGCPFHSPVSPSLPLLCVTLCHHISTGLYHWTLDV
jgi:hypothetical protein